MSNESEKQDKMKKNLLTSFMLWYNEDEEKDAITMCEIELYIKDMKR